MIKILKTLKENLSLTFATGILILASLLISIYGFTGIVGASSFEKNIPEVKTPNDLNQDKKLTSPTPTPMQSVDSSQDSSSLFLTPTPTQTQITNKNNDNSDLEESEDSGFEEDNDTEDFHSEKDEVKNDQIENPEIKE